MVKFIKSLKPHEIALAVFAVISIAIILYGIYALAFNALMGGMRDIMFRIYLLFSITILFLTTIIVIRKIHLKPKSTVKTTMAYFIVLPFCVLVMWGTAIANSSGLMFDILFVSEPVQTTSDGRLDYSLTIYNRGERHQRVELFIYDNETGASETLLLDIPFTIRGVTGGGPPYIHRIEMLPHEEYLGVYVINTLERMQDRDFATFMFDLFANNVEVR